MKRLFFSVSPVFILSIILTLPVQPGFSLIEVGGENTLTHDPGFPSGALEVANLESRIGYIVGPPFGGGEYCFSYQCQNTDKFNQALEKFNAIQVPNTKTLFSSSTTPIHIKKSKPLLLVIHGYAKPQHGLNHEGKRVDWTFTVWRAESFHRLFSGNQAFQSDHPSYHANVPPPRVDVYLGEENPIDWDHVKVPSTVRVVDLRAKESAKGQGMIQGKVFDMFTHQVIPNAEVFVKWRKPGSREEVICKHTKTGKDGSYQLILSVEGYYILHAKAKGYVPRKIAAINAAHYVKADIDIQLSKGGSLTGKVLGTNDNPLADIPVRVNNGIAINGKGYEVTKQIEVKTDREGVFTFNRLPYGSVGLRCRVPGLHLKNSLFERYEISPYPQREEEKEIVLVLEGTGTIKGQVICKGDGKKNLSMIVDLEPEGGNVPGSWGGSMHCEPDGSFSFNNVPPGVYYLTAKPNPARYRRDYKSHKVRVKAGETVDAGEIKIGY